MDAILEVIEAMPPGEVPDPTEGLRERKKRRVRQRISDVATAMFLVHGFDKVTVARIAATSRSPLPVMRISVDQILVSCYSSRNTNFRVT